MDFEVCSTEKVVERQGWPPLPGAYQVLRYQAPVAVCTLMDNDLTLAVASQAGPEIAMVGTLQTENLGIERLIQNVLANPHLRFLLVCGPDSRQAVGHWPGQSLVALFHSGIDDRGCIVGGPGEAPHTQKYQPGSGGTFLFDSSSGRSFRQFRHPEDNGYSSGLRHPRPRAGRPFPVEKGGGVYYRVSSPKDNCRSGRLISWCMWTGHEGPCRWSTTKIMGDWTPSLRAVRWLNFTPRSSTRGLFPGWIMPFMLGRELAKLAEHSLKTGAPYVQDAAPGQKVVPLP